VPRFVADNQAVVGDAFDRRGGVWAARPKLLDERCKHPSSALRIRIGEAEVEIRYSRLGIGIVSVTQNSNDR